MGDTVKVSERNPPSELFVGAILRAFDKAAASGKDVEVNRIWDGIVGECLHMPGKGFLAMFDWDRSNVKGGVNRIGTIAECIAGGFVPGLALGRDAKGREIVVRK